jgi:hypothetical protein
MIRWSDIVLGEFVSRGSSYLLKTYHSVGESQAGVLHRDANVIVTRYSTSKGKTVGYDITVRKNGVRVFSAPTYLLLFTGRKPTEHRFIKNFIEDPLFGAAIYKAGNHRDYMFINRLRMDEEDEEATE